MRFQCRIFRRPFAFLPILSAIAICAHAEPNPCVTSASQPGDVSLQLSLKNGQTVFREGEIIALIAAYSSSAEKKYYLDTREYDRSGRLNGMEMFCIDPAAGADPLSDYFNGGMGFIGGGLGGEKDLSRDPHLVNLELNEWKSLPPGSYRLRVASHRVTISTEKAETGSGTISLPLESNEVEFQVIRARRVSSTLRHPAWEFTDSLPLSFRRMAAAC